ncbi:uncharacterized protein [Palaemon carinicauda]|uniref:uncharacterized protein n=1 Tax=Palaemon carinicauda TaxID=392227 RepID=UPI0035B5AD25
MVDFGEETRDHFEESELALSTSSNVGYYHAHQTPRLSSWRQNGQVQEPTPRQNMLQPQQNFMQIRNDPVNLSRLCNTVNTLPANGCVTSPPTSLQVLEPTPQQNMLESHQSYVQVKNDPENLSRFCNTGNTLPAIGSGVSLSTDTVEDSRLKGQLLQEITRAAESFEPYNTSSLSSSNYRTYNIVSDVPHTSEADYAFSDAQQWVWARSAGDERSYTGTSSNKILVESTTVGTIQYLVPSQLVADSFPSSFPPLTISEAQTSIPSSNSGLQRMQQSSMPMSSSALDLSPVSPVQVSPVPPSQTSPLPTVQSSSAHQLLPSQNPLGDFDTGTQQQELSYHQNLEGSISLAPPDEENEENPDDVLAYPPELKCDRCGATFSHAQHLNQHIEESNCAIVLPEGCAQVVEENPSSQVTEENKRPQRHQAGQTSSLCKQCGENVSKPEKLKEHDKPFHCSECTTTCSTKTMLARHKKIHTGEKPYSCIECKTSFTESGSLKVHMRQHTGDRPYKCSFCNEAFSGAGMLASHRRKHTGEKPYVCNDCGASFRLLSTLKSHSRRHTGEKPFSCELCGKSFTQKAALRRHKRTHLNVKPYECDHCGFKFREKENLRRHLLLHKIIWPFVCDICGAGFNYSKKLETHKMLHNGGDKPYKCNKCSSSFASPKYLTQHKKRVHDRKGSVRCEECNATFTRKETLRSHLRIHKGSDQYVCEQCGAAFNQRATLTRHIRIHLNLATDDESPSKESFTCKFCKKVFKTKTSLDSHVIEAHTAKDFAYECPTCHSGFSDQSELARHKSTHHQTLSPVSEANEESIKDKYVCEDCDQTFLRKWQLRAHWKYCLCRDLDAVDNEPVEIKPNISSQNNSKEVSAMKLVSAVLAAAGSSSGSEVSYQAPPRSDPSPVPVPLPVASTSSSQQSQHCTSAQVSLAHSGVYEHVNEIPQEISYQQPAQEVPQHSANVNIMHSMQEALRHNSVHNNVQNVDRESLVQGETQGTLSQHSLREDMQHHSFDFDISQTEFYKTVPSLQSSHHHNQHYNHLDTNEESALLQGSVLQDISQEQDSCEDLHMSFRHSGNFISSNREVVQESVHQQRGQQRLSHIEDNSKEQERESFHPHSEIYQNTFQDQFHSYSQSRFSKTEEKYVNRTELQPYVLQDQTTAKVRNSCPKLLGSYSDLRSKY